MKVLLFIVIGILVIGLGDELAPVVKRWKKMKDQK